jgi:hypothetical protein
MSFFTLCIFFIVVIGFIATTSGFYAIVSDIRFMLKQLGIISEIFLIDCDELWRQRYGFFFKKQKRIAFGRVFFHFALRLSTN